MQNKEICWNITSRCNQGCRYCHRFLNIPELNFKKNKKILRNLINRGVTNLTWTGGEPLLYYKVDELMKIAHNNGIKNKLITNGSMLTIEKINRICGYLDSITLSIDSIDPKINIKLGRDKNHFYNIDRTLEYLKRTKNPIRIRINTVINSYNINNVGSLMAYLSKFNIDCWRIFMFMPLREIAVKNKNDFQISYKTFDKAKKYIIKNNKAKKMEFRKTKDMESKYLLILANGDIIITKKGKDIRMGNALIDNINKWIH